MAKKQTAARKGRTRSTAAGAAADTKKRTVFISSTFEDLAEHRGAVWQVLEGFNVDVRGMEQFGARPETPLETCLAEVEQSDVYVGIVAFRLGSVEPQSGKSFTQIEYERAQQLGRTVLIYLADESSARVRYVDIDLDPGARDRLAAFKTTLRGRHTVSTFSTAEDLAEKIKTDFAKHLAPKTKTTPAAVDQDFRSTVEVVKRFILVPKTVLGREVRIKVATIGAPFPASRALCRAFNLEYPPRLGGTCPLGQLPE